MVQSAHLNSSQVNPVCGSSYSVEKLPGQGQLLLGSHIEKTVKCSEPGETVIQWSQYNTVQYITVQYSTVAVQYSTLQYNTVQYSIISAECNCSNIIQ